MHTVRGYGLRGADADAGGGHDPTHTARSNTLSKKVSMNP